MQRAIDSLISVCCAKDIEVFTKASPLIYKFIKANNYIVIVPDNDIDLFEFYADSHFNVISENTILPKIDILNIAKNKKRPLWYYQQLLKINALYIQEKNTF